ncbi:MAG: mechanosensitive ion channel [Flavobacteriaceae bacterium]|nr:mechanosensitive ion channel [Flavobacteriaceae bacterium]MDG1962337.1 mechanosensitive ion channel [Flavobacteriaceae bacterium]
MVEILMIQDTAGETLPQEVRQTIWNKISEVLGWGFHFGEGSSTIHLTVGTVLLIVLAFFTTGYVLGLARKLYTRNLNETDTLKFISVFKFIRYLAYIIVVFSVLSFSGVNVTPVLAASAALLVGVGLALQELFQDVLGGIFIMLDQSLQAGDIIEMEGRVGRVVDIRLRTTRAITRDDKVVIIPNHKFLTDTIYNYTQNHKQTRESVQVGVAYGSDTQLVKSLLLKCVSGDPRILSRPKPFVLFDDFGDSALIFSVNFFVSDSFVDPIVKSDIRFKIEDVFRQHEITIPFPQRDVHMFRHD